MASQHSRVPAETTSAPPPPWLAGAAVGLAVLAMAAGAMSVGAAWALGQASWLK